jgi:transcriptional regulator with XRE-family HTH domain
MARRKRPANVVGPQIQRIRYQLGLTQEQLAAQCRLLGLDISRSTLAQIEAKLRCVVDSELFLLALVLKVTTDNLFPDELRMTRKRK